MSLPGQILFDLLIIIYFTVKRHHNGSVLIIHRLFSVGNTDNAQPAESKSRHIVHMQPFIVGAPVLYGIHHFHQIRLVAFSLTFRCYISGKSTHTGSLLFYYNNSLAIIS